MRQAEAAEVDHLITRLAAWFDVPRDRVAVAVHRTLNGRTDAARPFGALVHGATYEERLASLRRVLDLAPE